MRQLLTRREWLGSLAAGAAAAQGARLPNIVLCMGDDHGWNETGYNGHPYVKTPVLDDMAARGLRFERFYSAHPSCSPTRGSIMTGRHPVRYGTFNPNWSMRPEEITIAQILRKAGYATGHFGKWHLGPVKKDSPTSPGAMGFDEWLSHDNFFELDPVLSRNGEKPEKIEGESSAIVVREAMDFAVRAKRQGKPFFAVVWFGSPHEPYEGVAEDLALYKDLDERMRHRMAEITAMDRAMGQLRRRLTGMGARENTLLWDCGDNGTPADARTTAAGQAMMDWRGNKGQVYEGGVLVPAIIEWPTRIRGGRRTEARAVTTDMLPTLCALTGTALPPRELDGESLAALIEGKEWRRKKPICIWQYEAGEEAKRNPEPYLTASQQEGTTPTAKLMDGKLTRSFTNYKHPRVEEADYAGAAAIIDGDYKYVTHTAPARREKKKGGSGARQELFDLRADRLEAKDVAAEQPEVAARLAKALREWQTSALTSLTGADYR
jgi:arylsulfatase A-like enzyme